MAATIMAAMIARRTAMGTTMQGIQSPSSLPPVISAWGNRESVYILSM